MGGIKKHKVIRKDTEIGNKEEYILYEEINYITCGGGFDCRMHDTSSVVCGG